MSKVLIYFGDQVRELPLANTRNRKITTDTNLDLSAPKHSLPLTIGFLYDGQTYTNKKGRARRRPSEALLTLDIDHTDHAATMAMAVRRRFGESGPVFLSKSASGKDKAHFFVSLKDFGWFDPVFVVKAMCAYIGIPTTWIDVAGVRRCFLTASLLAALERASHLSLSRRDLEQLGVNLSREKPKPKCLPWKPQEAHYKAAELTCAEKVPGRSKFAEVRVLAFLLAAGCHEQARSISQDSLAKSLGITRQSVSLTVNKLESLGIITQVKEAMTCSLVAVPPAGLVEASYTLLSASFGAYPIDIICQSGSFLSQRQYVADKYIESLAKEAKPGMFNTCEVSAALAAAHAGWTLEQLLQEIRLNWVGWSTRRRERRMRTTWGWALRHRGSRSA